jgi:hypothetical protein
MGAEGDLPVLGEFRGFERAEGRVLGCDHGSWARSAKSEIAWLSELANA